MTWDEILGAVVSSTGHDRFRWLCSDDNPDAAQREGYRAAVLDLYWNPDRPEIAMPPEDEWTSRIRECPDHNPGCCASPLPFCSRFLIHPTREKCIACLTSNLT